MSIKCLITITCAFLLSNNCFANAYSELKAGEYLRPVTMLGINVLDKNLSSYRGKPLIINVWASWCGPCRAEMTSLERLKLADTNDSFNLIGVSTDDYHKRAIALVKQTGITFDNFRDRNLVLEKMLGANRIPLTIFVDREGKIIQKINGFMKWDHPSMIKMVKGILSSKTPNK